MSKVTCVFFLKRNVQTSTLWSGCSPAAWWWWSVCPCPGEWTFTTSRRARRSVTTATPTTSSLSGSTDRWEQRSFFFFLFLLWTCCWTLSPVVYHGRGLWYAWKSPSTSITSETWNCSRPSSTPPSTHQVQSNCRETCKELLLFVFLIKD